MAPYPTKETATCRRCGTCCEHGGPALHGEDRQLIESGSLRLRDLVTIRNGEPAYDQRQGLVLPAPLEFIKLAGSAGSWSCRFYEKTRGCGIYGQRPLECRLLFCRDTGPVVAIMGRDLLSRHDLLAGDDPILPWLARLEREIVYPEVMDLLAGLDQQGSAAEKLARLSDLVRADLALRESFLQSFPKRRGEELFLLGRPLFLAIAPYGCRLIEGTDGLGLQYTNPG